MDTNLVLFIVNILLLIIFSIAGFWLKSLHKKIEEAELRFQSKPVCEEKHITINEKLDKLDGKMDHNFTRLYDKVDVANSIGEGFKELAKVIKNNNR